MADAGWTWLATIEGLDASTPGRRFEFVAGRACVAEAMRRLGRDPLATVRRHGNGAPVWPAGMTGSITHTRGFVSAAVATTAQAATIGIDSEVILTMERAVRVAPVFASRSEISVGVAAGLDAEETVTVTFAAKEAIFKCLYGFVRRMFDYEDVRIIAIDTVSRQFTAAVVNALGPFPAGSTLCGRFDIASGRVHTGIVVSPRGRE